MTLFIGKLTCMKYEINLARPQYSNEHHGKDLGKWHWIHKIAPQGKAELVNSAFVFFKCFYSAPTFPQGVEGFIETYVRTYSRIPV